MRRKFPTWWLIWFRLRSRCNAANRTGSCDGAGAERSSAVFTHRKCSTGAAELANVFGTDGRAAVQHADTDHAGECEGSGTKVGTADTRSRGTEQQVRSDVAGSGRDSLYGAAAER